MPRRQSPEAQRQRAAICDSHPCMRVCVCVWPLHRICCLLMSQGCHLQRWWQPWMASLDRPVQKMQLRRREMRKQKKNAHREATLAAEISHVNAGRTSLE